LIPIYKNNIYKIPDHTLFPHLTHFTKTIPQKPDKIENQNRAIYTNPDGVPNKTIHHSPDRAKLYLKKKFIMPSLHKK
jgi:hypothetical protein